MINDEAQWARKFSGRKESEINTGPNNNRIGGIKKSILDTIKIDDISSKSSQHT